MAIKPTMTDYGVPAPAITCFMGVLTVAIMALAYNSQDNRVALVGCAVGAAAITVFWPYLAMVTNIKVTKNSVEVSKKIKEVSDKADEANTKASGADEKAEGADDKAKAAVEKAIEATRKANDAVDTLTRFVFNSMPQPTFNNLLKIARASFGNFDMSEDFRRELRLLRNSGYIETHGETKNIGSIPSSGAQLSDFVRITELGKEFIDRRIASLGTATLPD